MLQLGCDALLLLILSGLKRFGYLQTFVYVYFTGYEKNIKV